MYDLALSVKQKSKWVKHKNSFLVIIVSLQQFFLFTYKTY